MMGDEVTKAIDRLSRDFREVLILCDVEGFTYEEIADITEVKIGTVRSRLHRARKLLQQELREYATAQGFNTKLK
jgi:RNA polymerase sigma-70 factor (ECF subfamily)